MTRLTFTACFMGWCLILASCADDFLDVKPNVRQRVPQYLSDYQALLDNTRIMNYSAHALGIIGSDDFFVTGQAYNAFPSGVNHNYQKRAYTWERQIFQGGESALLDWNDAFSRILWSNVVLDGMVRLSGDTTNTREIEEVKGSALFHRAYNYYNLAQLFCATYTADNAHAQLGLPLRTDGDLTSKIKRSTLKETFDRIILDLKEANSLLPDIAANKYRPSRAAALAMLAKTMMQMGNYDDAYEYANQCLAIKNELLDFNELTFERPLTFTAYGDGNPEVIFMATCPTNTTFLLLPTFHYMNADTNLLASYEKDDLRLQAYWQPRENGTHQFKGSYDGTNLLSLFTGLAIDEVLLIKAECAARLGNTHEAVNELNRLREMRIRSSGFEPLSTSDNQQALRWVIEERRKELVLRGTRWEDLRRLNKEPQFQKALIRILNDTVYELLPNDPRYVWPIPVEAMELGGYQQNMR